MLRVQVLEQHPDYAMTALSLGDQHIWVSRIEAPQKTPLRIRIQSSDVSLSLQPPLNSTIRNVLPAQVSELVEVDNQQVEVKLRIGASELWARITPRRATSWRSSPACGCSPRLKAFPLPHKRNGATES